MNPEVLQAGLKAAHDTGKTNGLTKGAVVFGGLGLLAVGGLIWFSVTQAAKASADKENAVYEAANFYFSNGIKANQQEQKSRVVTV